MNEILCYNEIFLLVWTCRDEIGTAECIFFLCSWANTDNEKQNKGRRLFLFCSFWQSQHIGSTIEKQESKICICWFRGFAIAEHYLFSREAHTHTNTRGTSNNEELSESPSYPRRIVWRCFRHWWSTSLAACTRHPSLARALAPHLGSFVVCCALCVYIHHVTHIILNRLILFSPPPFSDLTNIISIVFTKKKIWIIDLCSNFRRKVCVRARACYAMPNATCFY